MRKFIRITVKAIIWLLVIILIIVGGFIVYITVVDYTPEKVEILSESSEYTQLETDTFSFINWNIGYAGLGKEMDFFYDGGTGVRPSKELHTKYLSNIIDFVNNNDTVDFWLIQEVDKKSKRSYNTNEVNALSNAKKNSYSVFATNYKVPLVPVPIYSPMGHVDAGLMVLSDYIPETVTRHAYPLIASWPQKLFLLDRCFTMNKYHISATKDLVIVNTHNSAYVYDSVLRVQELMILRNTIIEEYENGNYVIVGGDWNQNPPGYKTSGNYNGHVFIPSQVKMNDNFMPSDWEWAYDNSAPTNRHNDKPFTIGINGTTCLDYYLLSPNLDVIDVRVMDLMFESSDHNPVYLKVELSDMK